MQCVYGDKIYTGTEVKKGYVLFNGKKISGISKTKKGKLIGRFPVVSPAIIDPHSHIGMHRAGEPGAEGESNEHMDAITPLPDALDSVQMDDTSFMEAIEMGVLYSCVVPGSGNIIGGLSAVIRNYGRDTTDALICRSGVKSAFGYNPMSATGWKGTRPSTRMGALAMLRDKLVSVRNKEAKRLRAKGRRKKDITFSPADKVIRDILARKVRLRAHVHKIDDIAGLLRLVDEFKIDVQVEHACDVHKPEIFKELAKRKIPVTYGPVDVFAYKVELKHESWRNVKLLVESGAEYGLMTDHPVTPCRQLFLQTRWFTRAGLSKQEAIELVTMKNAKILGIDKFLGSLTKGKWASFICWNGDPFDVTSYPTMVYGEGEKLFEE